MPEQKPNRYVLYVIAKPEVKLYYVAPNTFSLDKHDAHEFIDRDEMQMIQSAYKQDLKVELGIADVIWNKDHYTGPAAILD